MFSQRHTSCLVFVMLIPFIVATSVRNARDAAADDLQAAIKLLEDDYEKFPANLGILIRQIMGLRFYVEEQTRSDGASGIGNIRNGKHGSQSYFSATHSDNRIAAIHDHSNNIRTIGMGEVVAVLNGFFFRTRHNDYRLMQRSMNSTEYGAIEEVPFPPVPPEVTQKSSVEEQITEMKEWFKAWANQDDSERDYKKYFKPVLCYLEGAWTNADPKKIDESFFSDRHHLDATSWLDLQDKARFTSYSGTKDGQENFAYLPTTIMSVRNDSTPVLAQWNYKILCHPLKNDLPLNRLNLIDDARARMAMRLTMDGYAKSRSARFQISMDNSDRFVDKASAYSYLDELMAEVPGPEGYKGHIEDDLLGTVAYPYDIKATDPLNVVYYNREYRVKELGAQGLNTRRRGFVDPNLFVAQTTDPKIAGLSMTKCFDKAETNCKTWDQSWSYAIPLEILYMTPLSSWNPYDIEYRGNSWTAEGKTVTAGPNGKRNGGASKDKAYNGINSHLYYMTPYEFFQDMKFKDAADTTLDYTHVLDSSNSIRKVRAAGHRIFFPNIPGVGDLRQRYPILPLHGEGSSLWKETAAFYDMVQDPLKYARMYDFDKLPVTGTYAYDKDCTTPNDVCNSMLSGSPSTDTGATEPLTPLHFKVGESSVDSHSHEIEVPADKVVLYNGGTEIPVVTTKSNGHVHYLLIEKTLNWNKAKLIDKIAMCDAWWKCKDGHPNLLQPILP